jgi:hypothetical protein
MVGQMVARNIRRHAVKWGKSLQESVQKAGKDSQRRLR